jgi:hypothetical protein
VRRLIAVLLFLIFADDAATTYAQHGIYPFFAWVHHIQYDNLSLKMRPFDIFLVGTLVVGLFKRVGRTRPVRPMHNAVILQFVTLLVWFVYGVSQGGDARTASWQTYLMMSAIGLTFVLARYFRTAEDYVLLAKALVAAAVYRAVMLWYAYFTVVRPGLIVPFPEFVTSHDDTVLWVAALLLLVVEALQKRSLPVTLRVVFLVVLFLGAILWNQRRLAWVSLSAAGVAMLALTPSGRTRRRVIRYSLVFGPLIALYVGVGSGRSERIFKPLQAISTVSTEEDASTKARNNENLGLIATAHTASPWVGTGWGKPFISLSTKYSIAQYFELWQYVPHNSILGLLAFMGVFGFGGYWLAFPTAVFLNARVARLARNPLARTCGMLGVAFLIVVANQFYGDMGLFYVKPMYVMSACFAMAMRLPAVEGLWRRSAAAAAPEPAAAPPGAAEGGEAAWQS